MIWHCKKLLEFQINTCVLQSGLHKRTLTTMTGVTGHNISMRVTELSGFSGIFNKNFFLAMKKF
jgi:hypothetical protein